MSDRAEILAAIAGADKFLITTHENPDGDAIGSLVAMHMALSQVGKDSVMFMRADEFPLPHEYRGLLLDEQAIHFAPADLRERTVIFLDCGNIDRMKVDFLEADGDLTILNIDHHHDNTRFGAVNLVVKDASCTAEILFDLLADLGVSLTPSMAEALYVALVTDSGMFMYSNTGPAAHEMAAVLIRAGVDVDAVYRRLYADQPFAKLELLARALARVERYDDGLLTLTNLTRDDFFETGSEETYSEGVVDHMRAVEGTAVGALIRELTGAGRENLRKVSLRATDDRVDVSVIARSLGGGGHRRAAGATTALPLEAAIAFIRDGVLSQLRAAQPAA